MEIRISSLTEKIIKTVLVISFFLLAVFLFTHSLTSVNQDISRHIKSGELIWQTKEVYKTNLFSFTAPDFPFINHHWLSEVIYFFTHNLFGFKGIILLKSIVLASAFGIIFFALRKISGILPFAISGLLALLIFLQRTDARPEMFSYLFLALFLFAILKAKYENNYKYLYILPFVELFWVNMHIFFVLGPGILFLFLVDRLIHSKDKSKFVFLILVVVSLATLFNPSFIKGAFEPLTIFSNYGYSIVENQSMFFLQNYGILGKEIAILELSFFILITSFIVSFKLGNRKLSFEILAAIAFSIFSLKMIRMAGPYALVFLSILAINLKDISVFKFDKTKNKIVPYAISLILILATIWGINSVQANSFFMRNGTNKNFGLDVSSGAEKGIEFIKENNIKGPVFNNFDVGSFLIWKLYPDQKVFVDGRPEAYPSDFFEKIYKPMQSDQRAWEYYSDLYKINYVIFDYHDITPWARTFLSRISQDKNWPLAYQDNSVVIFLKNTPENLKILNK